MAKSLRSKWKRKMKAEKRERYGVKELDKLNKMLAACGELTTEKTDVDVKIEPDESGEPKPEAPPPSVIIPVICRKARKPRKPKNTKAEGRKSRKDEAEDEDYEDVVEMEDLGSAGEGGAADGEMMSVDKTEHIFSKRSMRDQFGNYPQWMSKKKMRTQQNKNKRIAKRRALSVSGKKRK